MLYPKKNVAVFVSVALLLLNIACNSEKKEESRRVFRYNESQGISTLDPAFARSQVINWAVNQLFNGLVQMNDTLGIEPCIAHNWEISDDGKLYTFYIRNDVFFHRHERFAGITDRKVTAFDFEYSFNRVLNEKTASPGTWIFAMVDKSRDDGFKAINDSVFQIKLKQSFPAFLGILTMQYCSVVPMEIVEYYGKDFGRNPVGTGPFFLKYWKEGEKLIMLKNPGYFETDSSGNKLPYLDAVAISFVKDKQSEFLEFLKGNIDFLTGVHTSYKNELITKSGELSQKYRDRVTMLKGDYLNTEYLAIFADTTHAMMKGSPLRFRAIREAINYGFDREKMMKYMRNNLGRPADAGFIPAGLPGYTGGWGYAYNPDTARVLVEKTRAVHGGLNDIRLTTTSDYLDLCEFIQHELQNIGLTVNIEVSMGSAFRASVANSELPFFRASWIADYPDAENYLALFCSDNFSPAGPNYTHFKNAGYDSLYRKSFTIHNEQERTRVYQKMDRIIHDNAVIVPLYYDQVVLFTRDHISGLTTNPINLLVLKKVKKRGAG